MVFHIIEEVLSPIFSLSECLQKENFTFLSKSACFTAGVGEFHVGLAIFLTFFCFFLNLITKNDSWVDRLWSIIPVCSAWIYTLWDVEKLWDVSQGSVFSFLFNTRLLFTVVITLWGARLTYNFYRKGGYSKGGEDYRWMYVRKWPFVNHPLVRPFFNFFIVSAFQICLILAFVAPVSRFPTTPLHKKDFLMLLIQVFTLILETIADQQQWNFHQFKQRKQVPIPEYLKKDCERGFLTHGLFTLSRHPNILCEQLFWFNLFASSTLHAGFSLKFFLCPILLISVIDASTILTEKISSEKYPKYRFYQQTTPFIFPFFRRSSRGKIDRRMSVSELTDERKRK